MEQSDQVLKYESTSLLRRAVICRTLQLAKAIGHQSVHIGHGVIRTLYLAKLLLFPRPSDSRKMKVQFLA